MSSSFLTETSQPSTKSQKDSSGSSETIIECSSKPLDWNKASKSSDEYNEYVQMKKRQKQKQNHQATKKNFLYFFRNFFYGLFVIFVCYYLSSFVTIKANPSNEYQELFAQTPPIKPKSIPTSSLCNQNLPYLLSSQKDFDKIYRLWYGKVGSDINSMTYDIGHFIEKHIAVDGQCTYQQSIQGKTVFYDWNEVLKAFKKTSSQKCAISDPNTFSYQFQINISNPSQYIKGIDCRAGVIKRFPKMFILYRRAVQNANPYQDQYLASNFIIIWTFYPKN